MAHFALLDDNNKVLQVIVVENKELIDENGQESEAKGIEYCKKLFGGKWVQTSYNKKFRKYYAGIGYYYDEEKDAFVPPQTYPSWHLVDETMTWEPPVPRPNTDPNQPIYYDWDEATQSWVQADPSSIGFGSAPEDPQAYMASLQNQGV
jgi:hypothetical protein